jgi:hypothetical protein
MKTRHCNTSRILFPAFLAAVGLLLFSCTQFFSTSWAPWAARDYGKLIPAVTVDNVNQLTSIYENDPDGSLALLKKIQAANDDESSPELEAAALKAAVNSIGLVSAIAGVVGELSNFNNLTEGDTRDLFQSALDGMKNLEDASKVLADILPSPDDKDAWASFTETASADDLAMGAVVLLLGEVSGSVDFDDPDALDDYLESLPDNKNIQLAKALVEASIAKSDELSGPLKDILDNLNLSS